MNKLIAYFKSKTNNEIKKIISNARKDERNKTIKELRIKHEHEKEEIRKKHNIQKLALEADIYHLSNEVKKRNKEKLRTEKIQINYKEKYSKLNIYANKLKMLISDELDRNALLYQKFIRTIDDINDTFTKSEKKGK